MGCDEIRRDYTLSAELHQCLSNYGARLLSFPKGHTDYTRCKCGTEEVSNTSYTFH
jgi:hypothetical protein